VREADDPAADVGLGAIDARRRICCGRHDDDRA
jgi:hypothetical protein